jgi:FAD/FMN-containing dehydrogenase
VVVQCRNTSDVQAAIATARAAGLMLAVRGGGHDWAGRAISDGLVIDLTAMNGVVVSLERKIARVGGGARAIDLTSHTDQLGVCAATGSVGVVGLGGLVLGGGYGPLIGRCGLAADKLVGAEVVLADGRIVIASEEGDRDLLWALRGGGGNFGVVTALSLQLEPSASMCSSACSARP